MVTRKPVTSASMAPEPQTHSASNPPYPSSPHDEYRPEHQPEQDRFETRSRASSNSSHDTWNSGFSEDDGSPRKDIPAALRLGPRNTHGNQADQSQLPGSLRAGPPHGQPVYQQPQHTGQTEQANPWAAEGPRTANQPRAGAIPTPPPLPQAPPPQAPLHSNNPHNPYLRMQSTGQTSYGADSQAAWGGVPSQQPPPPLTVPPPAPVELPTIRSPTEAMSGLTLGDQLSSKQSTYNLPQGLQPALVPQKTGPLPAIERQHSGASSNPWQDDMERPNAQQNDGAFVPTPPLTEPIQPPQFTDASEPVQAYKPYQAPREYQTRSAPQKPQPPLTYQEQSQARQQYQASQIAPSPQTSQPPTTFHDQAPQAPPIPQAFSVPAVSQTAQIPPAPPIPQTSPATPSPYQHQQVERQTPQVSAPLVSLMDDDEHPPAMPPRPSEEVPPPQPPRPAAIDVSAAASRPLSSNAPETPLTKAKRQRNETYQIKQINWFDSSAGSTGKMRRTPIMTQNANGPCPLLALVNALTLSTPDHIQTALIDALRSREQVSLGLLLDAVFEELARRSEISDKELPDVGDLYSFLITLHTGMNVNPQFVTPGTLHVGSVEPSDYTQAKPGVFEETREMLLYSTFDIPLIHGWTSPQNSHTYAAFERSAKTFDEALNIQFREQELDEKLHENGLTPDEQQTYEDIALVKEFLETYPTQLTDYGLQVMSTSLKPGQIAILFRNDHFSTLYKDPRTGALMTLVTDTGYSTHDEIVWESLADVSGAANELFSGDFRPVGNTTSTEPQQVTGRISDGWETVHSRDNDRSANDTSAHSQTYAPPPGPPPGHSLRIETPSSVPQLRSASEQEDHDLALALQLQEEEEQASRSDAAARRAREDELSREFLNREHAGARTSPTSPSNDPSSRPPIPPRRSNLGPPRDTPSPGLDAPYVRGSENPEDMPPSYEQAASDRPFRPPGHQPRRVSTRQGDPLGALNAIQAQQRAHSMNDTSGPSASTSSMSVNNYGNASGGGLSGQPAPASMAHRRRSSGIGSGNGGSNGGRMRRSQSQTMTGNGSQGVYGDRMGGSYNGSMAHAGPGNRIAEQEKCVVM